MFGGVKNISRLAIYSEQYMLMLSLYSLTSHVLKQSIVVLKICAMKIFYNGKLSKRDLFKLLETAIGECLFLMTYFINKMTEWQLFSSGSHHCKCISMSL